MMPFFLNNKVNLYDARNEVILFKNHKTKKFLYILKFSIKKLKFIFGACCFGDLEFTHCVIYKIKCDLCDFVICSQLTNYKYVIVNDS